MLAPLLDDHICLLEAVEDLAVEQFIAQFFVEALAVTILPGTASRHANDLSANACKSPAHDLGRHLGTVDRPDVLWDAAHRHDICHSLQRHPGYRFDGQPGLPAVPGRTRRSASSAGFYCHHGSTPRHSHRTDIVAQFRPHVEHALHVQACLSQPSRKSLKPCGGGPIRSIHLGMSSSVRVILNCRIPRI